MSLNVLKVNSSPPNAIVSFNCFLMHSLGCNIAAKQTLCCIRFISIILEYLMLFLSLCVCVCIHDRLLLFFFYRCILMSTAVETVMCESLIKRLEVRSHSLPSDQEGDVGADGSEPWHLNQQTGRGTLPSPDSFVNRLSQYLLICVQLVGPPLSCQHTEGDVCSHVWPLAAVSASLSLGELTLTITAISTVVFMYFLKYFFILTILSVHSLQHWIEKMHLSIKRHQPGLTEVIHSCEEIQ